MTRFLKSSHFRFISTRGVADQVAVASVYLKILNWHLFLNLVDKSLFARSELVQEM